MAMYFYKIGNHVLLSGTEAVKAIPSKAESDDFAFLQFDDGVYVRVIAEGDSFGR